MKGQDGASPVSARAAVAAFGLGMALVAAAGGFLSWGQHRLDQRRLEEGRALIVARAVAEAAVASQLQAAPGLDAVVLELTKAVPGLGEAFVLKGPSYVAHSDPEKAGKRLVQTSLEDKALFDKSRRIQKSFGDNRKALEENPDLGRKVADEQEVDGREAPVVAAVAVVLEDRVQGMAQATLSPVGLQGSVPWVKLLLVAIVATAIFGLLRTAAPGLAHPAAVLIGAGAIYLALVFVQAQQREEYQRAVEQRSRVAAAVVQAFGAAGQEAGQELLQRVNVDQKEKAYGDLRLEGGAVTVDPAALDAVFDGHTRSLRVAGLILLAVAAALYFFVALGTWGRGTALLKAHAFAYAYTIPAMVGMVLLVFVPFGYGVVLGFMQRIYNVWSFVGFDNFVNILWDFDFKPRNFYFTFCVTVMWTVLNVALHVSIGLGLALLLQDKMLKLKAVYRVLLVVPWAVPNYITALIWQGMFHKEFGAVNHYLGVLGVEPLSWFGSFWTAFAANLATNTWLGFPFMMVISLGALQSIPGDLYEAAEVDGASWWQQFRRITLPLLKPALFPAIILGTIWTFNQFNIIYLVSAGQPANSTDILIVEAFRKAFENDNYGGAAAYSTIIFLILLTYTMVSNRWAKATAGAFD